MSSKGIECEVPGHHVLREVEENDEDKVGENYVPVFEVRKEETSLTKGDLKLHRIVVTENNLESMSRIPKLLKVFEKDADQSKEKENDVKLTVNTSRRSSIPRLNAPSATENGNQEIKKHDVNNKRNGDKAFQKNTEVSDINFNKYDVLKESHEINTEKEVDFDNIYENIVDEEVILEDVIPVNIEDTENIDLKFDKIVKEYDDDNTRRLDTEKVKKRIPFLKQKSLQNVLPKRTDRRSSLKEFHCYDEPESKVDFLKDESCRNPQQNQDVINTYSDLPGNKDVTKNMNGVFSDSDTKTNDKVTTTSKIALDENNSISLMGTANNSNTVTQSGEEKNLQALVEPAEAEMKRVTKVDASNDDNFIETTKDKANVGQNLTGSSVWSRIAIFENSNSGKSKIPLPKTRRQNSVSDLSSESKSKAFVIDVLVKLETPNEIKEAKYTGIEKLDETSFSNSPEDLQTNFKVDGDEENIKNPRKLNDIHKDNIGVMANVVEDTKEPVNIVEFDEVMIGSDKEIVQMNQYNGTILNKDNVVSKEDVIFSNTDGKTTSINDESSPKTDVFENPRAYKEKQLTIETAQHADINNEVVKNPIEAKNKTMIEEHKFLENKSIPVLKPRKTLSIFDNNENTKVNTKYEIRRKSVTEVDTGEKIKGKVQSMIVRIKSIENLSDDVIVSDKPVINVRERPRRKSVSDKIALFEAKNLGSPIFERKLVPVPININTSSSKDKQNQNGGPGINNPKEEQHRREYNIADEFLNVKDKFGQIEMRYLKLRDGTNMPLLALGTALLDPKLVHNTICAAIDMGYRAIDTAYIYGNEEAVGHAIRAKIEDGTVQRSELYIISKLWSTNHRQDLVEKACRSSLEALGLSYVDLYLIHNPMSFKEGPDPIPQIANVLQYSTSDYLDAWFGMETLLSSGLVRSIGVSNFNSRQLARVVEKGKVKPVINQVECHPYLSQARLSDFCSSLDVTLLCYGVLGSKGTPPDLRGNLTPVIDDPLVTGMAEELGVTPAQLLIRYQIDRGHAVVAKASRGYHLWDNLKALQFNLTRSDIDALNALNRNKRTYTFKGMGDTHRNYPFNIPF